MALKSTIFKARLNVADMDRNVYGDFNLTLARHPSETDQRMMLRLLAFALNADEQLEFGRGISTDDEPDLWGKNYTEEIDLWIDLGTPDEKRIRKACGQAREVIVYAYNERSAKLWWEKSQGSLQRHDNLTVCLFDDHTRDTIGDLVSKSMRLQITIQDNYVIFGDTANTVSFSPTILKAGNDR